MTSICLLSAVHECCTATNVETAMHDVKPSDQESFLPVAQIYSTNLGDSVRDNQFKCF